MTLTDIVYMYCTWEWDGGCSLQNVHFICIYILVFAGDVEYSEVDIFLFLKPSDVSEESLPPFFVGTVYPPLPADSDLQLNNISPGLAP